MKRIFLLPLLLLCTLIFLLSCEVGDTVNPADYIDINHDDLLEDFDRLFNDTRLPDEHDHTNIGFELSAGGKFTVGDYMESSNRLYRLHIQNNGNLVLYKLMNFSTIWSSNTSQLSIIGLELTNEGNLRLYGEGAYKDWGSYPSFEGCADFTPDGYKINTLPCPVYVEGWVLRVTDNETYWQTATSAAVPGHVKLILGNDGNLILLDTDTDRILWQSYPVDPILEKMKQL